MSANSPAARKDSTSSTSARPKQAACLECRRSKTKCTRSEGSSVCQKCNSSGLRCIIPEYHIGRYKGVKNKRTSLEKAIYQVQQAIKRSNDGSAGLEPELEADLRHLLGVAQTNSVDELDNAQGSGNSTELENVARHRKSFVSEPNDSSTWMENYDAASGETIDRPDEIALDNADNPLELLAMASVLPGQSRNTPHGPSPASVAVLQSPSKEGDIVDVELQQFFGRFMTSLDNSSDSDPVNLGLVTTEEADRLFGYFFEKLSNGRWGLDPILHTSSFVRSRSAFLFTSIMAASALFLPDTGALQKRLSTHHDKLHRNLIKNRHRSVEIVLAYIVSVPWITADKHDIGDDTCSYLSEALRIALDLSLNKITVPSSTIRPPALLDKIARAECIDSAKALQIDGFPQIHPTSPWGRRLLRSRERAWLSLFVLDRGVCLTRGRPYAVPCTPLVDHCDTWHISDIADPTDGGIISAAVLRRDLVPLINSVRAFCNSTQESQDSTYTVKYLKDKFDRFFEQWSTVWSHQLKQKDGRFPAFVEILLSHTKLSIYCSVVNHGTASADVKQFFCAAGLASAINVMRAAVEGENRQKAMSNNAVIMVSFAATFVLALGASTLETHAISSRNALSLIEDTIKTLEHIGSMPPHRKGLSILFAKHIRNMLQIFSHKSARSRQGQIRPRTGSSQTSPPQQTHMEYGAYNNNYMPNTVMNPETYLYNMTDDQLLEAINNASASQELFQLDESMFLDSFGWPYVT